MSNFHFKNCCGEFGNTLLFQIHPKYDTFKVLLENIKITNVKICEGIRVSFESKVTAHETFIRNQHFMLINATLSTGGKGVSVYDLTRVLMCTRSMIVFRTIRISNVLFNGSCLSLRQVSKGQFDRYEYSIINTTFAGRTCLPALSVDGMINIEMSDNIIMVDTAHNIIQSQPLVYFTGNSSFLIRDHFNFRNNKGALAISSHTKLTFYDAIINFVNNTIGDYRDKYVKEPGAVVSIESKSSVFFNNSKVVFIKNKGKQCGGIIATDNVLLLFTKSTANFIGNSGELGGTISLYFMSVLMFVSNVHMIFSCNRALKGGAIFVDDGTYIRNHTLQVSAILQVGFLYILNS